LRKRPSARLLVVNPAGRLLLFRFVHRTGALSGQDYWATPGGEVKDGETFEHAASRELQEETGICAASLGQEVWQRTFVLQLPNGEYVIADERYFLIRAATGRVSREGWTAEETDTMVDHHWWSMNDLSRTAETVWPKNLVALLEHAGVAPKG
jgi:8-oxo-dGTP diphosphatase